MKASEHYETASQLDSQGKEEEALEHYLSAFKQLDELDIEDQKGLILGLGSTYRWLGNLGKSEEILNLGIKKFPSNKEYRVFLALTFLDCEKPKLALAEMLEILLEESTSTSLLK